jgi:ribosomal-protein-alanine N-acetyltransferase
MMVIDKLNQFPTLNSNRLVLREFRRSDAQGVYEIFSQDIVTRHHNQETMKSIEEAERVVKIRTKAFKRRLGIRWAIVLRKCESDVIGSCGYYNLDKMNLSAEIGYDLHPDYWRQGIMSEALGAVIDYGFSDAFSFSLNRIQALTYVDHDASAGLLLKMGFQAEGIRREHGCWKGAFHDLRCFSLLRRDWFGSTEQ